ncbi:MAG: hypothetical protein IJ471_06870, partial [Eubacterium sp.]|nr:hypothetical protein [Eubacterium sp.]
QITVDAEGYTLNTEAPMKYFFFNFTRFEAEEVDENMATFDATSGLLKINMNCSAAMDEKAEVADGLTLAKITLSYVSNANAEETISGTAKMDLTESVQTDDEDTKDNAGAEDDAGTTDNTGTPDSSTTTTAPKTGDAVGNMYLVFAAGAIVAILAASRVGRRARA